MGKWLDRLKDEKKKSVFLQSSKSLDKLDNLSNTALNEGGDLQAEGHPGRMIGNDRIFEEKPIAPMIANDSISKDNGPLQAVLRVVIEDALQKKNDREYKRRLFLFKKGDFSLASKPFGSLDESDYE